MLCDKGIYFSNENNPLASCKKKNTTALGDQHSTNECFIQVSSFICNSLIWQSSPRLRAKNGTEGNSRRASLITHSRYFSFFRSSVLTGRSDVPLHIKHKTLLFSLYSLLPASAFFQLLSVTFSLLVLQQISVQQGRIVEVTHPMGCLFDKI